MAQTKRDYYEVLSVTRTATVEEIKRSYRRLAMKYHPDRADGNKAEAEAHFKECAEAYEVLSDETKRRRYDQYGHQGVTGQHDFSHMDAGDIFSMFDDIFGGAFGGGGGGGGGRARRGAARGFDLETQVELTLAEIANGAEKTIEFEKQDLCENCKGSALSREPRRWSACSAAGRAGWRSRGLAGCSEWSPRAPTAAGAVLSCAIIARRAEATAGR